MREAQWQSKYFAKELRREQTAAEKKLWSGLRNKRLGGYRFLRQHPIDSFIVDFACLKLQFIIELDGPPHDAMAAQIYDAKRTKFLKSKGWTLVRYANDAVFDNLNYVLDDIALQMSLLE